MKKIIVRTISGIIYIALIVGALYLGNAYWYALTGILTIIATLEYQSIQARRSGHELCVLSRALDMSAALLIWGSAVVFEYFSLLSFIGLLLMLIFYVLLRAANSLRQTEGDAFGEMATSVFGVIYTAVPLSMLNIAMMFDEKAAAAILWMFALIWINDTGAFCVGTMFGKHRLCERLSPKKSWEGFWGGMGFCIIASVIYAIMMHCDIATSIVFGVIVSLFATWGDLFESMLKRSADVKDSGHIMPGHGGVLDRIDSLLFVAPAAAIFAMFLVI